LDALNLRTFARNVRYYLSFADETIVQLSRLQAANGTANHWRWPLPCGHGDAPARAVLKLEPGGSTPHSDRKVFMTSPESRPFEVETTFQVSREGVATVTVDPFQSRSMDMDQIRPAVSRLDQAAGPVEVTFARGESATGYLREEIDEVESTATDAAALFGVVRRLTADAFMRQRLGGESGLDGLMAHEVQAVKIPGDLAAGEGFAQVARSCLTQVSTNAQLLRRGSNREALHQLRVGVRRLRAAFATFEPILPRDGLDRWKTETKWLAGELNAARNLDVFIDYVARSTKADALDDPMLAAFVDRLILAQAMAYDVALAAIDSKRFAILLPDFTEWIEVAAGRREDAVGATLRDGDASVLAAQALKRLHRQLRKTGKHLAKLDPAGRHEVRIKAKKLRYAAEFFSKTFGKNEKKRHSRFISSLARLQGALGELNDMATARQYALAVAGDNAALAFRAGQIVGRRNSDEPRLLGKAVWAYEQWSKAKLFWS
jgi:CHAD domain-containing protein